MGVRDRQKQPDIALVVVIDKSGSMAACHCNTFDRGRRRRASPASSKVDIGKEAILRAAAALTDARRARRRRLQRGGPLGRPDAAARRRSATSQGQIAGIHADGQTNIYAGPRPGGPVAREARPRPGATSSC